MLVMEKNGWIVIPDRELIFKNQVIETADCGLGQFLLS